MAVRKPLVQIAGQLQELPNGDTLPISYNGGTDPIMSSFAGPLTTFTGTYRYYHPSTTNITGVYCSVGTPSSSGSVVIDVKKNGTTIFSGTYPTITASNYLSSLVSITSALTSSDYLTIDVTSAGVGTADLNVYIVVEAAPVAEELSLTQLSDVTLNAPSNGQVLKYNGTAWVNDTAPAGASALNDLTDVTVSTPATGQVLKYNGTDWENAVVESALTSPLGIRNKIIGGDFTINPWQRGTTFTNPSSGTYTADRWAIGVVSPAQIDVLKTADAPTATQAGVYTQHCLHLDVTTSTNAQPTYVYLISTRLEGTVLAGLGFGQSGVRYATLSFWHKHTKTGTYCVAFRNNGSARSYVAEYVQDTTNTWEKATITIPADTTGTWLSDTGLGLQISFVVYAGSTYQTTANTWTAGNYMATANQVNACDDVANNFKIALVQFEAGSVATPFEYRSAAQEEPLCYRYYYREKNDTGTANQHVFGAGYVSATTTAQGFIRFPVRMRTTVTALEQSGTTTDYRILQQTGFLACNGVPTLVRGNNRGAQVAFTTNGLTVGDGVLLASDSTSAYLGFSAEI